MIIIKRDGREEELYRNKIAVAINKVFTEINFNKEGETSINTFPIIHDLTNKIIDNINSMDKDKIKVEQIQNIIEKTLSKEGYKEHKKAYSEYRKDRTRKREIKSDIMSIISRIGICTDRDNANIGNNFSAKLLRIASESNKWHNLAMMPKDLAKLHENGDLYFHDLDSFNLTTNCLHIPTGEILKRGFNAGYGTIRMPKRIESAAELSCILLQASQNDCFGGMSHPNFDNDMAEFVNATRQEIYEEYSFLMYNEDDKVIRSRTENKTKKCIRQAMQSIVYNLNSMASRAGSQVPFSSLNIGLPNSEDAALVCEIFLEEYEKGLGKSEQAIFPNIIFRVKKGVNAQPEDPYYYLFQLACRVASTRMNPTFMSMDSSFNKKWYDKGIIPSTMGCRTYVLDNINGEPGAVGRGNIAPVTLNLPRLGLLANHDIEKFFSYLNSMLLKARESLLYRYDVLKKLKVSDLPFVAGQGLMKGSENLLSDDSIEPILKQGTWAIGFIGLAETLIALVGKHHGEDSESLELGYKIVKFIRDFCDKYKEIDRLNYSCYATPAEGLSSKFTDIDRERFGNIDRITSKEYYTNSYHVPVDYSISIKNKILTESYFHSLCNGGHITYIELDDYPDGETIEKIIKYAYQNSDISYIGINFHIRYCKNCGKRIESGNSFCPKCGSTDIQGISRTTGYLSLDERFTPGKDAERRDRISHEGKNSKVYRNVKLKKNGGNI